MSFTLAGYFESQAADGLTAVAGLTDDHLNVEGDNIRIPNFAAKIIAAIATGITLAEAQITSPKLKEIFKPDLAILGVGAAEPPADRSILNKFLPTGLELKASENMRFFVDNGNTNEPQFGLVWLSNGLTAIPAGQINVVKATGSTTVTANAWSTVPLTFSQTLPAGNYAVVGMRAEGVTCVAARLIFTGSGMRPGAVGTDGPGDVIDPIFRKGGLGVWGIFENTTPPRLEMLCTAADTAQTIYLDMIGPF